MAAKVDNNPYVYFFYSAEHIAKKNEVESNIGRRFDCGTVIVNGAKKKYSYMSTTKNFLHQYPDAKLITEGYKAKMQFTECDSVDKGGN